MATSDTRSQDHGALPVVESGLTRLRHYGSSKKALEMENFDLIAKVIELLTTHDLWGPDGTYSFEDGERWARLKELEDE